MDLRYRFLFFLYYLFIYLFTLFSSSFCFRFNVLTIKCFCCLIIICVHETKPYGMFVNKLDHSAPADQSHPLHIYHIKFLEAYSKVCQFFCCCLIQNEFELD